MHIIMYTKTRRTPNYINLSFESNTVYATIRANCDTRALVKNNCGSFDLGILYNLFIVITVDF